MSFSPEQIEQNKRLRERMSKVRNTIVVMSGKGGVGKSTVATNLAFRLAQDGFEVGLVDVDIHGPNIPKMLGIEGRSFQGTQEEIDPVEVLPNLKVASIAFAVSDPDAPFIWRGPMKMGAIRQFLADVVWGDLDYLIVDTPPGTGDEPLTVFQTLPKVSGAVVVTTPQDVAILDSRKSVGFAKKMNVRVLGIVENMSGFVCPHCGEMTDLFSKGGGEKAAKDLDVAFLGRIPLEPKIVMAGDGGSPYIASEPESVTGKALESIILKVQAKVESPKSEDDFKNHSH